MPDSCVPYEKNKTFQDTTEADTTPHKHVFIKHTLTWGTTYIFLPWSRLSQRMTFNFSRRLVPAMHLAFSPFILVSQRVGFWFLIWQGCSTPCLLPGDVYWDHTGKEGGVGVGGESPRFKNAGKLCPLQDKVEIAAPVMYQDSVLYFLQHYIVSLHHVALLS